MSQPDDPYKPPVASLDGSSASPATPVAPSVVEILGKTRPWVKLIPIVFVVLTTSLLVFTAIVVAEKPRDFSIGQLLPMLIVLGAYVPPVLFLWRYAAGIRRLQDGAGLAALEAALTSQKSFWKYIAILISVMTLFWIAFLGITMR